MNYYVLKSFAHTITLNNNFLELLHEHDLIEIVNKNEYYYLHTDALSNLENITSYALRFGY